MYEKLDQNDSLVSWMIAGGARLDEPDARRLGHLVAIRDGRRDARSTAPFARLARFAIRPSVTASASSAAAVTSTGTATTCCAPA